MKVKGDVKKITVTQRQLASAFGVTPARVNHLIKDEIVVRDEDNPGGAVLLYESVIGQVRKMKKSALRRNWI